MKKYLPVLLLAFLAFGCKTDQPVQKTTGLIGNWELIETVGGIVGGVLPVAKGTGNTIQFNADSTFKQYQYFKLVNSGAFHIVKNGYSTGQGKLDALSYNGQSAAPIQLQGDTLSIGVDYDDMQVSFLCGNDNVDIRPLKV